MTKHSFPTSDLLDRLPQFFPITALALMLLAGPSSLAAEARPIRALLITGGCCHDYNKQRIILPEGVSARANVVWTVVQEGGTSTDHRISIYEKTDWAEGYDVIVHNECFADVNDPVLIENVLKAHRDGTGAVVIHCTMHTFRALKANDWREFLGVTSTHHGAQHPLDVKNLQPAHPIMKTFPDLWITGNEELYAIDKLWPNAAALAQAPDKKKDKDTGAWVDTAKQNTVVWVNTYGKGRVFGTTLAHNNATMSHTNYLDMLTRGLLWTVGKLGDDGQPAPGYEPKAKSTSAADSGRWSAAQIFPTGEKPAKLFGGENLDGWEGQIEKYWSVKDGVIIAKNTKENAPKASTYLTTRKTYRNFRLVYEGKLVTSEMHSGISLWGKNVEKEGDAHSYQGHLVMFPSNWGFWDLYRRNGIYNDDGRAKKAGRQHDWNQMEILAIGSRIRLAVNGQLVADWTDPKPELCERGPIGLQLHSNTAAQEIHFRGLILSEDPQDRMITVKE
jgi:type 1 glutamine amidotransferase